jgi:hypothetical protein
VTDIGIRMRASRTSGIGSRSQSGIESLHAAHTLDIRTNSGVRRGDQWTSSMEYTLSPAV